jgi:hypothetical protein
MAHELVPFVMRYFGNIFKYGTKFSDCLKLFDRLRKEF